MMPPNPNPVSCNYKIFSHTYELLCFLITDSYSKLQDKGSVSFLLQMQCTSVAYEKQRKLTISFEKKYNLLTFQLTANSRHIMV